jgi:hypothetical protein
LRRQALLATAVALADQHHQQGADPAAHRDPDPDRWSVTLKPR